MAGGGAGGGLVVVEGTEGAGKTTQVARLAARARAAGLDVLSLREPGGTPVGDAVRALLLDGALAPAPATEALLFMASRAELLACEVRPALARGALVLLDRFFLSTYAYQVAGRRLPADRVRAANALATDGLVPAVTLLLDLPVADGLARAGARGVPDRIEREGRDFHDRVAAAFRAAVAPEWQAAHPECGPIVAIDAQGTLDDVTDRAWAALAARGLVPAGVAA